ncbi:MAG: hypothetical protein RhofKO_06690 [Rhodothermales bacterium]
MERLLDGVLMVHIAAGALSLALFWIPIFTAKGKRWHRQVGRAYVYAMGTVVLSASVLSLEHLANGRYEPGGILLLLAMLTAMPLVAGVQILRAKKPEPWYRWLRVGMAGLVLAVSSAVLVMAAVYESGLLMGFGIVGMIGAVTDGWPFLRASEHRKTWLREHYEGLLFSGAAAYTAFLVFGGRTLFAGLLTGWWTLLPWLLPTALTFAALPILHRRYTKSAPKPASEGERSRSHPIEEARNSV